MSAQYVYRIQSLKDNVHQLGINAALTLTQDIEHVFGNVAALNKGVQLEEACPSLYRVESTEDGVEKIHIIRAAFEFHQLLGQQFENLAGLYQEILEDFFIGVEAHSCTLQKGQV